MEKSLEKALDNFVDIPETEEEIKIKNSKKLVLKERSGLIERIDKVLVTKDGKQLLREAY